MHSLSGTDTGNFAAFLCLPISCGATCLTLTVIILKQAQAAYLSASVCNLLL